METISKHITLTEATKSASAIKFGIDNTPPEWVIRNMDALAENVFEPLRAGLGGNPIFISSFYRSDKLNRIIGGAKGSQHTTGEAMDIDNDVFGKPTNREIFGYIRAHLEFDQLIWEYGDEHNPEWVHVSYRQGVNRNEVLRAIHTPEGTKYLNMNAQG